MEIDSEQAQPQIKLAHEARNEGDSDLKVCYIFCKCDPDYLSAVPNYEKAAKQYHTAKNYKEEIYCREKLVLCQRNLKDTYSEGSNLEKIANVYLQNLNMCEDAFKSINNAHLAYRTKGDYQFEILCLVNLAQIYRDKNELVYAEKCLKLAHDEISHIAHIVTSDKEHSYDYIYKAMNNYCVILILQNKMNETINACQDFLKAFEEYEDKKSKVIIFYGLMAISLILTENHDKVNDIFEEAKKICQQVTDYETMNNINECYKYLKEGNDERFNMALRIVDVDYDNAVIKKFKEAYNKTKGNAKAKENKEKNYAEEFKKEEENSATNFADAQL